MENSLTFDQLPNAVQQLANKLENIEKLLKNKSYPPLQPPQEQLLTIQEAAEFLKLTVPTIYSKVSRGELPVMKRGKRLYFSRIELMQYLKAGRKRTNVEIEQEAEVYLSKKRKG
jgi:excisionase family DNA binding protein